MLPAASARILLVAAAVSCVSVLAGCGGGTASPSEVANAAGASSCDNSGFYIQSKLTNTKEVIYDCRFAAGGLPKCVTYSGNIASNATEEVSLLFSNSVGSGKPPCLTQWKAAKARKAAAARLAKMRKFLTKLKADRHAAWHRGYTPYVASRSGSLQLPNVYFKFLPPGSYSCTAYLRCWKIEVVTRNGCPSALSIELQEYDGSTQIGTAYGEGGSIQPRTDAIVEVDTADAGTISGSRIGSITCF